MTRLTALLVVMLLLTACSSQSQKIEELSASPSPAQGGTDTDIVRVLDSGFVWDGETLSYAFTATNSSEDTSLEETAVQVSVYGKTGEAIAGDSGVIDFILPGQTVAFAGHIPLTEESERIAFAFSADKSATVDSARTFDVTDGKFSATGFGGRVGRCHRQPLRSRAQQTQCRRRAQRCRRQDPQRRLVRTGAAPGQR